MSSELIEDVPISSGDPQSAAENGGETTGQLNGVSNGHDHSSSKHKSSSKDKYRDKDRDHKSSKSSSSRDKSSSDKKHSSSSSGKDKHRDKDRDKNREKDRQREKDRDKDRSDKDRSDKDRSDKDRSDKHKSSSSSHKSSTRDKDKEREKDRQRSDKSKSSRDDKDREKNGEKDKDRERNGERDKDKDRRKDHKSSSSSNSKSRSDSDRHKSSSSSSKNKHSSSSSSSKHRSGEKSSSSKDHHHSSREDKSHEHHNNGFDNSIVKDESISIKREEVFNMSQASSCDYSMSQFKKDEPQFDIKEEASDNENEANASGNNRQEIMDMEDEDVDPLSIPNSNSIKEEEEEDDDDDVPLMKRKSTAINVDEDSEEDVPLLQKKKQKVSKKEKEKKVEKKKDKKVKREIKDEEDDYDEKPLKKKIKKEIAPVTQTSPTKKRGKAGVKQEEPEVWRWWEEEKRADGVKWNTLEHKGPVFAPPYEPLPKNVKFYYDGKEMKLATDTEEAATFYAKMLNHDYVTKKQFNENFFKDFRKTMTSKERDIIKDLKKCNFQEMFQYFTAESEKRKNASKEEKAARKAENEEQIKEYGFCIIDGHKERIGNFRLEPPGLFRGRGEHPKMGMIKRRIVAEDVSLNCSKDSKVPVPPPGHRWKDVRHDNTVTWLASWTENVQGQVKYIMLNPSSKLKGEKDHVKYETARRLDKVIDKIRSTYRDEWKSKEMRVRQRAVALYFIDKLALRAGNEKDEDQADTVGCCSLRVEHVSLHKQLNGKENVVVFDFLGKDSIRYYNEVEVEKRVFKNLELFMENKKEGDDLFDRLNTQVLNEHLKELMDGLTAKVFRTYNASITLQNQLDLLTDSEATIPEKLLAYNRANRAVAILCNHQRSVPKSHAKSMETLKEKIRLKREQLEDAESEYPELKRAGKRGSVKEKCMADKKLKTIERLKEQLKKLELQETDRDENKSIALGTSKLNYLDPRISVAWCKKNGVPIEKIFNKTQREKFNWAIHMADENYRF
ncbi:DNA topoisomerase 1 isoform X2 [Episyrphus balteatus]|uniref:DNA topoisomerase 1 isoform X2 n=1 Tax=Episyrphus balteatus TaxID=286459 RepID=UPI0024864AA3|nr:DNA topoisomerase 1 isoform X2 [Episyrphus balteatus]